MGSEAATPRNRPVVVGVDGSPSTPATVDLAAAEAARRSASLRIVHVWPGRYRGVFRSREAVPSKADGMRLLEVTHRRAALARPGLPIVTELLEGGAATTLTGCSGEARLLVVGHRDEPRTGSSWGSTAAYLAHHSTCPLLVNRGAGRDGPVVVASSARPSGAATLGYAFAQAALLGSRLVAVHSWIRPGAADGRAPTVVKGGYTEQRRAAEARLIDALAEWSARFPDVAVERLVVSDLDLACTIDRASHRGRLLVAGIGAHGRFAELLYGAGQVGLRGSTCPVALVPVGWPAPRPGAAASIAAR
ncbi:universal stress protein [Actinoplanes sp. KI2]|uniref:universal stress protein n=1 Tax=Actinoplanes sp. KI2 TaxID=2983315 RepID=UPI0021D572B9|nr:universal stress protein [Actinoplanes sp. KI2]MCU7729415.1 universal stress protein [Actinoplanes sp. KI2]